MKMLLYPESTSLTEYFKLIKTKKSLGGLVMTITSKKCKNDLKWPWNDLKWPSNDLETKNDGTIVSAMKNASKKVKHSKL